MLLFGSTNAPKKRADVTDLEIGTRWSRSSCKATSRYWRTKSRSGCTDARDKTWRIRVGGDRPEVEVLDHGSDTGLEENSQRADDLGKILETRDYVFRRRRCPARRHDGETTRAAVAVRLKTHLAIGNPCVSQRCPTCRPAEIPNELEVALSPQALPSEAHVPCLEAARVRAFHRRSPAERS